MAQVSIKDKKEGRERRITLKAWFQAQVSRLGHKKEIKDFAIYGPLNSFYYSARVTYGGDLAIKTRSEWNALFRTFTDGPTQDS